MKSPQLENPAAVTKFALLDRPIDGKFMRRLQRLGKRVHGHSAAQVAACFQVTRPTFKAWQTGKKTITDDHAHKARSLYREWAQDARAQRAIERARDGIVLSFSRGMDARMRHLEILSKPRRCDGCGKWFVPRTARQKRHNRNECRNLARRRKAK